jgi:hypothetical protein
MAEKETQVESKETPHLVNMEIDTIVSMVDRVAGEFVKAEEQQASLLASELVDTEFFNLFFALEFLFKSEEGRKHLSKLASEENAMFLHAVTISEIEKRTGLTYNSEEYFLTQ